MTAEKFDVYSHVTNQIIAQIEAGTPPWRKPWTDGGVDALSNPIRQSQTQLPTGRPGITLILRLQAHSPVTGPLWRTWRRVRDVGISIFQPPGNFLTMEQGTYPAREGVCGKLHARSILSYLKWALIVTVLGLALGAYLGWVTTGTVGGMLTILFICAVLAVLEISLSFDNAIVNANKLKNMRPEWQRRFLTWGILIAVFGMRILFPLLIVVIAAKIGPWQAITLAASQPEEYARIMHEAHLPIAAFGGAFLMMVGLSFFFDHEKDVHWVRWIEHNMAKYASIRGIEVAVVLATVLIFSHLLDGAETQVFFTAAVWGLLTFLLVEVVGGILDSSQDTLKGAARGGLGAFLYLEVLDASFSFDGVIGAFALSQNLFVIAIGLGIGAMYVRSMTIMLVENGTLAEYRFLEHGAFYAILALSVVMFVQSLVHIPEVITGLGGATLIGISLWSSIHWNQRSVILKEVENVD
jgi:uncharacterized protein